MIQIQDEYRKRVTKSEPDYSTLFSSIAAFPMLEEAPD
jgi:hypothetical protein